MNNNKFLTEETMDEEDKSTFASDEHVFTQSPIMLTAFTLFGTELDGLHRVILYSLGSSGNSQDVCQHPVNNSTSICFKRETISVESSLFVCLSCILNDYSLVQKVFMFSYR